MRQSPPRHILPNNTGDYLSWAKQLFGLLLLLFAVGIVCLLLLIPITG